MTKSRVRTNFRIGPFQITGSPALAVVLGVVVLLLCCVLPCIVGAGL